MKKFSGQIPFIVTIIILWNIFTILSTALSFFNNTSLFPYSLAALILSLITLAVGFAMLVYYCYHWYNDSITDVHWDFNQEITIIGNQVLSKVTSGEDTFTEVLFIRKTIKKKDYTIYYQDSHHYVIIPDGISPVSEEEANHL